MLGVNAAGGLSLAAFGCTPRCLSRRPPMQGSRSVTRSEDSDLILQNSYDSSTGKGYRLSKRQACCTSRTPPLGVVTHARRKNYEQRWELPRQPNSFLLLARGFTNAEIGQTVFISEAVTKGHLRNIPAKLSLASRVQLIAFAYEHRLLSPATLNEQGTQ